ncbi:hypothetical protein PHYBOEH_002020 [Phytophthora boehmeriae]|uniref:Uncharacterized protein n=1 Tax=Phytophthora boehmeriae TaxID=109152 RepID=A0A8T1WYJ1_9STRA|nr:hypothetical protein PHYBOEH_002020 [Phytophthora boehmeriae]
MYSTYSYKNEMGKGRFSGSGPVLLESRATNSFGPANSEVSNGLSPRSTADFSQFGGGTNYEDSQFGEDSQYIGGGDSQYVVGGKYGKDSQYSSKYGGDSQYFSEYSVSTGPEIAGPSRVTTNHHFVDINSMANTNTEVHKHSGEHPLTVSQLSTRQRAPMAIAEDEEEYHSGGRRPAPKYGSGRSNEGRRHQSPPPPPPYTDSIRQQAGFGVSTASSMRSDYDIVDPITMRDVEQRNTEMLMEDSRYPKFSFASDASDIYDDSRDSSEEEVDVHGLRHGERMI